MYKISASRRLTWSSKKQKVTSLCDRFQAAKWFHVICNSNRHVQMLGQCTGCNWLNTKCDLKKQESVNILLLLFVGVHHWFMIQTFPPPASSSLSTMKLAPLSSELSKGNEQELPTQAAARTQTCVLNLISLLFFSLLVLWCELLQLLFKK